MISSKNFNSFGSSNSSRGSYSSLPSFSNIDDKKQKCQNKLKKIYSEIISNRESLFNITGLNIFMFSSNTAKFLNDMSIIERQLNFILQKIKNRLAEVEIKERLQNHYDQIQSQKKQYIKVIDIIRQNNIVSPDIVKCAIFIEKYFEIQVPAQQQDEEEFDSLEIPSEIQPSDKLYFNF